MLTASKAQELGRQAFKDGLAMSENPFLRTSRSNGGVMLAAWWESGYTKARLEQGKQNAK